VHLLVSEQYIVSMILIFTEKYSLHFCKDKILNSNAETFLEVMQVTVAI
jgi:hypothetical protein